MPHIGQKVNISSETMSAIFIIAFVSLFILANFLAGFIFPLFVLSASVAAAIAFFYPRSGMSAIVFLTFIFERFFALQPIILGRSEYKIYPLDIIFGAVLLGTIYHFWKQGFQKLRKVDYYLVAFIIFTAIYFFVSAFLLKADFALSFSSFKHYAFYPLFYFAIILLFEKKEKIFWLLKFAFAGAVGITFFIIYGLINGAGLWSEFTPLSTEGVRTLAFTHAFYVSITLIGLVAFILTGKNKTVTQYTGRGNVLRNNSLYYVLAAVWIVGIVGSMMRHLWGALALSLLFLYFFLPTAQKANFRKLAGKSLIAVIIAAIFIIYLSSLFPNSNLKEGIHSIASVVYSRTRSLASIGGDESFFWRNVVWNETFKKYSANPFLGIGFGKIISVEIEDYHDFIEVRDIHNSLLVMLVQLGIVGFALFSIFVYKLAKKLYQKRDKDWIDMFLQTVIIFYFIVFLFQPYLETNLLGIFFWIILGLIRVKLYEDIGNK